MINSGSIRLETGEWWLTINTVNTGTMTVNDIGPLQYDFDLAESSDEITGIGAVPGAVSVRLDDTLDNLENLYDILRAELAATGGPNPFVVSAQLTRRAYGETATQNFAFELAAADVGYNQLEGEISIRLTPPQPVQTLDEFIGDLWNIATPIPRYDMKVGGSTQGNCYATGFIIDRFISTLGGDDEVYVTGNISNTNYTNLVYPESAQSNVLGFFMYDNNGGFPVKTTASLITSMAGIEGAFYGAGFGKNFYVARGKQVDTVTLTFDDVVNIIPQPVRRDISRISVTLTNIGGNLANTTNTEGYWAATPSAVAVNYTNHSPLLWKGVYDGVNVDAVHMGSPTSTIENEPLANNQESMARSLGVAYRNQDIMTIEVQVLSIDLVRPWQTFAFDSADPSIPQRYKNKVFRPSSISYDIQNDTAVIRAYQIS